MTTKKTKKTSTLVWEQSTDDDAIEAHTHGFGGTYKAFEARKGRFAATYRSALGKLESVASGLATLEEAQQAAEDHRKRAEPAGPIIKQRKHT